jgi:pyruvate dehydrogenase E1 component alpha subunit
VAGYGIPARTLDGNDVLAVYEAARQAAAECRAGRGPVFLELLTYRMTGHSRRDPIETFGHALLRRPDVTPPDLEQVKAQVLAELGAAIEEARRAPKPTAADLTTDVYA